MGSKDILTVETEEPWGDSFISELKWKRTGWKEPYMQRIAKSLLNTVFRNLQLAYYAHDQTEDIIRVREKQVKANPANLKYRYELAKIHLLTGDYKRALGHACRALEARSKLKDPLTDRIADKVEKLSGLIEEEEQTELPLDAALAKIICHVFNGEFPEALQQARSSVTLETHSPEFEFLIADLYEKLDDNIAAQVHYRSALRKRISKKILPVEFFTESRNSVYRIAWDHFPSGTIYAKEYLDDKTMNDEWNNTTLFREILGRCIQLPLSQSNTEERTIFFRAAGEKTLQEQIRNRTSRETTRMLAEAAELLAKIHFLGTRVYERGRPPQSTVEDIDIDDVVSANADYFTLRLKDTLLSYNIDDTSPIIHDSAKTKIQETHKVINDHLVQADREFYKDHNPRNIIVDDFGNAIAIDFESSKLLPCQIDLVSLLEFGSDYITKKQKILVINAYIGEKERLLKTKIDRNRFMMTYEYARVQRHLEMIGYRSRDYCLLEDILKKKAELRRRQYHLKTAAEATRELSEREDSRAGELKALSECISSIQEEDLKLNRH